MTRVRINALLAAWLFGVAVAGRVSAHHSIQAQFDVNKTFSIAGTVAKVEFINPHSYLTVNVKDADGKVTKWARAAKLVEYTSHTHPPEVAPVYPGGEPDIAEDLSTAAKRWTFRPRTVA